MPGIGARIRHLGRGERIGEVVAQRRDARDLRPGGKLQLVARDARARHGADQPRLDAVLGERRQQHAPDSLDLLAVAARLRHGAQHTGVREPVRRASGVDERRGPLVVVDARKKRGRSLERQRVLLGLVRLCRRGLRLRLQHLRRLGPRGGIGVDIRETGLAVEPARPLRRAPVPGCGGGARPGGSRHARAGCGTRRAAGGVSALMQHHGRGAAAHEQRSGHEQEQHEHARAEVPGHGLDAGAHGVADEAALLARHCGRQRRPGDRDEQADDEERASEPEGAQLARIAVQHQPEPGQHEQRRRDASHRADHDLERTSQPFTCERSIEIRPEHESRIGAERADREANDLAALARLEQRAARRARAAARRLALRRCACAGGSALGGRPGAAAGGGHERGPSPRPVRILPDHGARHRLRRMPAPG